MIRTGEDGPILCGEKRRFNKAISGQIWLKVTLENDLLERIKKISILRSVFSSISSLLPPPPPPSSVSLTFRDQSFVPSTFTVSTLQYYITRKIRVKITRKIFLRGIPFQLQFHRIPSIWSMLIKISFLLYDSKEDFQKQCNIVIQ